VTGMPDHLITPAFVEAFAWVNGYSDKPIHDQVTLACDAVRKRMELTAAAYVANTLTTFACQRRT
jgi:hypothetical protein